MARAEALLPHPLSPTIPTVSPASTSNETPSTARTADESFPKSICKSWISSKAICAVLAYIRPRAE